MGRRKASIAQLNAYAAKVVEATAKADALRSKLIEAFESRFGEAAFEEFCSAQVNEEQWIDAIHYGNGQTPDFQTAQDWFDAQAKAPKETDNA